MGRNLRKVAVARLQHSHEDVVDFYAGNPGISRPDGGQHVAAAADANYRDVAAPDSVGQGRDVVLNPANRGRVAIPLGDHGSRVPIDGGERHRHRGLRSIRGGPPEKWRTLFRHSDDHVGVRIPPRIGNRLDVLQQASALGIHHAQRTGGRRVDRRRCREHEPEQHRSAGSHSRMPGETGRSDCGNGACGERSGCDVRQLEEPDDRQTSAGCADQVSAVQQSYRTVRPGERERHYHSGQKERNGQHQRRDRQRRDLRGRGAANRWKRNDEIGDVADRKGNRECQGHPRQQAGCPLGGKDRPADEHEHRTGRHAEHRDRHREKGQVVPRQHREQARIEHLQHQGGERDEEEARRKPEDSWASCLIGRQQPMSLSFASRGFSARSVQAGELSSEHEHAARGTDTREPVRIAHQPSQGGEVEGNIGDQQRSEVADRWVLVGQQ